MKKEFYAIHCQLANIFSIGKNEPKGVSSLII